MNTDTDVLIVGAGPTGLMLACQLSRHPNVSFRIIDKNPRSSNQSRAVVVHARSLEVLSQLNLVDKAIQRGQRVQAMNLIYNGHKPIRLNITDFDENEKVRLTKFPFILFLEQSITEDLLETHLNENHIEVQRSVEVTNFEQLDDGSAVEVILSNGETLRTKYVCACDGAHSFVRHELKIPFAGQTYSTSLFLTDSHLENFSIPSNEATMFYTRQGFTGIFPLTNNRYRVVGAVEETSMTMSFDHLRQVVEQRTFPFHVRLLDSLWSSMYRSHHRYVKDFRFNDRFFFLGDAAHIHSPVGGQGMNTGLQDAHNLGWKLAFSLTHPSTDLLLSSYHDERFPVAAALVKTTDRVFSWISITNWWTHQFLLHIFSRFMRWIIQPIFNRSERMRINFFKKVSQLAIHYSSLNQPQSSHGDFRRDLPQPGDRFPAVIFDVRFYHLVNFADRTCTEVKEFLQLIKDRYSVLIHIHHAKDEDIPLDYHGAFLVRPDGHVAYRTNRFDVEHFSRYFHSYFLA